MLAKHKVGDVHHLKVMFGSRSDWVPAYFRGTFFAEMSTTQRSESMNAILKLWLNSHTSIYQFVMKIEAMVEGIWHKESDEDIKTMNETPNLWSRLQIEHDAVRVYTRNCFSLFKEIMVESTLGAVIEIEKNALYEVSIKTHPTIKHWVPESYMVDVDLSSERFSCNYQGFEFEGFLCQHAIKVMQHLYVEHLPERYILKRWCKDANAKAKRPIKEIISELEESEALQVFRRATIRPEFRELENLAITSPSAFDYVRSIVTSAIKRVMPMVNMELLPPIEIQEKEGQQQEDNDEKKYKDPPLSQCKGRKKRPACFKPPVDIKSNTRKGRICSYCDKRDAHNIRTCPKRKKDLAAGETKIAEVLSDKEMSSEASSASSE